MKENKDSKNTNLQTKKFVDLVRRCVTSIPSKFEVLHRPGVMWANYDHVNSVIEHYVNCVPEEDRSTEYRMFVEMMPLNVNLLIK